MALKGVKVLEFVGLAPAPFCGKVLADFGASVTRIDKIADNQLDVLQNGKRTLAVNLKTEQGQCLVRRLAREYDVLIEPFRPGVMERMNLGPKRLCSDQPRLIYARLTGFGQRGRLSKRAGHDINYAAISGVLSLLGRRRQPPTPPLNLLADFAGGGLLCAFGICLALLERHRSGCGQVVDAAMIDGAAYVASWVLMSQHLPIWGKERGNNILDGGAYFYDTYATKDGRYMSVGALEPQFFELFRSKMELPQLKQFVDDDGNDVDMDAMREMVRLKFLDKTQQEWTEIFNDIDACVYPVLESQQAVEYEHNRERQSFAYMDDGSIVPRPAPRLSRTPGVVVTSSGPSTENPMNEIIEILQDLQLTSAEMNELIEQGIILVPSVKARL